MAAVTTALLQMDTYVVALRKADLQKKQFCMEKVALIDLLRCSYSLLV